MKNPGGKQVIYGAAKKSENSAKNWNRIKDFTAGSPAAGCGKEKCAKKCSDPHKGHQITESGLISIEDIFRESRVQHIKIRDKRRNNQQND